MKQEFTLKEFTLKEITPKDSHWIYKGLSNPKATKYYTVHFNALEETLSQMKWHTDIQDQGTEQ